MAIHFYSLWEEYGLYFPLYLFCAGIFVVIALTFQL